MIYEFNTSKVPSLSQVGGKAKSLIETTKAGLNVPEGFVLSVDFFTIWVDVIKSTSVWKRFLETPSKEMCNELKKLAKDLKFSSKQKEALEKALRNFSEQSIFAVRSSSPEEDLEGTSFAGMYETYLGVTKSHLENAIKDAFASMFDTRVVEYKKLNHISIQNPLIAIIVQRQIPSEVSGIAFSLNPQNNCYDEAVINASFGLGETIVSGQVTPDTYVVEKVKRKIIEKSVANKVLGLWLQDDGGTVQKNNKNPDAQALNDDQILQVSDLVTKCEKHYGLPIDMEWAIADGQLYLLQARPITTYLHLYENMITEPGEKKNLFMDVVVLTQGFSENFSVLGLDIFKELLESSKGSLMPSGKDGIILYTHGRQYINISNMLKGYGEKRTRQLLGTYDRPTKIVLDDIDLAGKYMPKEKTQKIKDMKKNTLKYFLKLTPAMIRSMSNYKKALEIYNNSSEKIINNYQKDIKNNKPFDELVDYTFSFFEEIIGPAMAMLGGMISFAKIKKLFKDQGMDDELMALNMDLPGNPTSAMGHAMLELASYAEVQKTDLAGVFVKKLKNKDFSETFIKAYNDYMKRYGARGFKEIDIATPRTWENPQAFFRQLKQLRLDDNQILNVRAKKEAGYQKLLTKAKELGKEKKFIKWAKQYNAVMGLREHPKYLFVVGVGALRKCALEVGQTFVKAGRLNAADQIFDLHVNQIAAAQKNPSLELLPLIEENISSQKKNAHIKDWPKIIDSRGKIFRYIRESKEGDLVGDAISPGIIRGKAKVLSSPYEKSLEKGEILVARATEPAWTPIFVNAAGVILEIGGPLQHGAIIAREYGIPCVSGIDRATEMIKDGNLVEVDGSSGIVKIINDTPS